MVPFLNTKETTSIRLMEGHELCLYSLCILVPSIDSHVLGARSCLKEHAEGTPNSEEIKNEWLAFP